MRKKIAVGVGLVAAALAASILMALLLTPAVPPLRVGMSIEEADRLMSEEGYDRQVWGGSMSEQYISVFYMKRVGNSGRKITATFDSHRLRDWEDVTERISWWESIKGILHLQ